MNAINTRLWVVLLGIMLCGLMPGHAFAENIIAAPGVNGNGDSAWTVYAFGNAQAVADTFRSLNNFATSSLFQGIVGFIAVLGALTVGLASGFSSAIAKKFIGYIVSVYLICYVFFGVGSGGPVSVLVEVEDTVDMTWKAPVTVPAVVGIPASVISTAGFLITQQIEASFAIPDELKMSNGAPFNLASSLLSDASQARISDPNLSSSLAYYVQDCFMPAVARGDLVATTLTQSTNFLQDIRWDSQSVMVMTTLGGTFTDASGNTTTNTAGTPSLVTCQVAWNLINDNVNASAGAADFLKNASAWAKTPALSVVNSAADSVAQWASNNGITDGGALVKQTAVLASFTGAFKQAAAATGNSDFLTGLNVAQAQQQQTDGWIMGAEVFNRSMGYVYAILQVFVYAATPLVLAAALVPGLGFALLKNFGQILLWMAIWQPMLSIVNFIVISMQQSDLGGALSNGAGQYGFTLSNMGVISQKTANMRAAALFIGTMVPALSWGLVKGSVDFSRFVGEAVGEKFAHSAAQSLTTGNYSLNQASMDSFTANKHSIGTTGDWGNGFTNAGSVGAINNANTMGGNIDAGFKQNPNRGLSRADGENEGGSAGDQSAKTSGALHAVSGGSSDALAKSGGTSESGGNAQTSSGNSNVSVGAGVGGNLGALIPGGGSNRGGPAGANTGMPNVPGAVPQVAPQNGLVQGAKAAARGALGAINVNGGVSAGTSQNNSNTHGTNDNTGTTGTKTITGSVTDTETNGVSNNKSAGTTHGYQKSETVTTTGVTSLGDRVAALAAVRGERSHMGNYDSGPAMAGWRETSAPALKSHAGQQMTELNSPGAVENKVAEEKTSIDKEHDQYSKEAEDKAKVADKKKAEATQAADAERAHAAKALKSEKGAAQEGALHRAGREPHVAKVVAGAKHVAESVTNATDKLEQKFADGKDAAKEMGANAATKAANVASTVKEKYKEGNDSMRDAAVSGLDKVKNILHHQSTPAAAPDHSQTQTPR
ncbi:conjugal transfer mating pair stabilization protein TraG [Novimethylophilus kurashikiensis]|uniref:Conjugal transfer mating pair stabilization protein TraG n=1 Tax=Novimethylophilus kurashikiensis TaxID=1825523 RepID=A0A2R5F848_9PROT|nr:conjugal transfer protein TraG N-terminal domain-containing protein [Novimethylophilus kurashikiensis]GBG14420.1 conjugal transfer mating pair stabilization protein TraG [Novimethylophilus kurashikiensis]